ncbi:MAG: hypothetical protein M3P26_16600 [Gemmatimonadota bacterium]|nr:hypothetical protein [Gemmatimonadota bacterium]
MRTAPNGFRERPAQKPEEIEIEIKPATAANIAKAQAVVSQKQQELATAQEFLFAEMRSLITERGIAEAEPIRITDTKPHKLVLRVLSYAKPDQPTKQKK